MTLVKSDPDFKHSARLGLRCAIRIAENNFKRGKTLKVRYFGLAQRNDIEDTVVPEIKSKPELLNNLPILAYNYYIGYPPRKTSRDVITTIREKKTKEIDVWLIDENLNIFQLPDPKIVILETEIKEES
jgi:undecaprenyl pyrophosphate synthase